MRKIGFFWTLSILIVLFNIINFFFLATAYSGFNVKESSTIFDAAFINYTNLEDKYFSVGIASDNRQFYIAAVLVIDLLLGYTLVVRTPKYGDYLTMPYKRINIYCTLGIMFHMFLFMHSVPSSSHDETFFLMIGKGMLMNLLWIIGYIAIIEFFYMIKSKKLKAGDIYNTKLRCKDVAVLGFLVELILSFFYTSLVQRITRVNMYGTKKYYGRLFLSQFMMLFKPTNYYSVEGKVESYPYMIICLIVIIAQILITIFLKKKFKIIFMTILSVVSIIVLTIGVNDVCDSIYVDYISEKGSSFFNIASFGYYFVVVLNIAMLGTSLWSLSSSEGIFIGTSEIEQLVNEEAKKKSEEEIIDNVYVINEEYKGDDVSENI